MSSDPQPVVRFDSVSFHHGRQAAVRGRDAHDRARDLGGLPRSQRVRQVDDARPDGRAEDPDRRIARRRGGPARHLLRAPATRSPPGPSGDGRRGTPHGPLRPPWAHGTPDVGRSRRDRPGRGAGRGRRSATTAVPQAVGRPTAAGPVGPGAGRRARAAAPRRAHHGPGPGQPRSHPGDHRRGDRRRYDRRRHDPSPRRGSPLRRRSAVGHARSSPTARPTRP